MSLPDCAIIKFMYEIVNRYRIMTLNLSFYKAHKQDAESLTTLINSAYRGEVSRTGWTTEADLLDGRRTDIEEVLSLITDDDSMFIVCKADSELQGSVHLRNTEEGVHIGVRGQSCVTRLRHRQSLIASGRICRSKNMVGKSVCYGGHFMPTRTNRLL